MKNDNYYTPTIDEFKIGFKYECYNNGLWTEVILTESMVYQVIEYPLTGKKTTIFGLIKEELDKNNIRAYKNGK